MIKREIKDALPICGLKDFKKLNEVIRLFRHSHKKYIESDKKFIL